jgi:tetratricopeptide (TPR) repeat protein
MSPDVFLRKIRGLVKVRSSISSGVRLLAAASLMVLLLCRTGQAAQDQTGVPDGGRDFAAYLKTLGLPALYVTELKRLCLEQADLESCKEYVGLLNNQGRFDEAVEFAEGLKMGSADLTAAAGLMKSYGLSGAGRYARAIAVLDSVIATVPPEGPLVDAVLLRAECQYRLGSIDEALLNLRQIEPYVEGPRRPDCLLLLARCEETAGDLARAAKLYQELWKTGSAESALGLIRCRLREGDIDGCLGVNKDLAKRGLTLPPAEAAEMALRFADVDPVLWHLFMKHVVADSAFDLEAHPYLAASIVRLAESGEAVAPYCDALLARAMSPSASRTLRYARALTYRASAGASAQAADSLAALGVEGEPGLGLRCLGAMRVLAPERKTEALKLGAGLLPAAGGFAADERLALCRIFIECGGPEMAVKELNAMLGDLRPGYDDKAMAEIAGLLEAAGAVEKALEVYDAVAQSPVLSGTALACEKQAFLMRHMARPEIDIAREVENIARKGASDLELADFFMDKLKDYDRASTYYAKAIGAAPEGVDTDVLKLKLARALALASFEPASGDSSGVSPEARRRDALALVAAVAGSRAVTPDQVILTAKLGSNWLAAEDARVAEIAGALSQRKDLTPVSLYGTASLISALFIEGHGAYYERCSALLARLLGDRASSKQAQLAAFSLGRVRFVAGDYAGAREAYQACAEKTRDPVLAGLCAGGIGDCYLYSGGLAAAAGYLSRAVFPGASYRLARCYAMTGQADSSLSVYRAVLARPAAADLLDGARSHAALVLAARGERGLAMDALDSPIPEVRERLVDARRMAAAYGLGLEGYRKIAVDVLKKPAAQGPAPCQAYLLASELLGSNDPQAAYSTLLAAVPEPGDIFQQYQVALGLAKYSCSASGTRACEEARQRFVKRFPLDQASAAGIDLGRAMALLEGTAADGFRAIADSIVAAAALHPLAADVLYRLGVGSLLDGDYPAGAEKFMRIVEQWPSSALYGDACFKLGSAYYMMQRYDSSAVFFGLAARSGRPVLVRDALFNWGLALEEVGGFGLAADAYRTLAVRFPLSDHFERALIRCGFCLQSEGKPAEATGTYAGALRYASGPEAQAETRYWIGEAFSEAGDRLRAACEFLRTAYLYPKQDAWAGTAAYQAGAECEAAGLEDHAIVIYKQNLRKFGRSSDWGKASEVRLSELLRRQQVTPQEPAGKQ